LFGTVLVVVEPAAYPLLHAVLIAVRPNTAPFVLDRHLTIVADQR
jgi:hypothetical protein